MAEVPRPVKRDVEKLAHSLTFPEPGHYTARRSEARFTRRLEEPAPMSLQDRFEELHRRNEAAELGGGVERIERQHKTGEKTARERLELLLDKGSFPEVDRLVVPHRQGFRMGAQRISSDGGGTRS